MDTLKITYRVRLRKRVIRTFEFTLNEVTGDLITKPVTDAPRWTELAHQQCPHCPLRVESHPHCPLALELSHIIDGLHDTKSFDEVDMEVITPERSFSQRVELQQVVGSMVGLVSPTCGCPKTAYMKPMARFHLPLATEEETLFRVTGMYLLSQYFSGDKTVDLEGLSKIYDELHIVNKHIASRLQHATESDSSKNAIALLDMYSNLVPVMIEDHLPEIKQLFSAYLDGAVKEVEIKSTKEQSVEQIKAPAEEKKVEGLALEALIEDVEVDELESLLGTQKIKPIMDLAVEGLEKAAPLGKAVFKLPDDE